MVKNKNPVLFLFPVVSIFGLFNSTVDHNPSGAGFVPRLAILNFKAASHVGLAEKYNQYLKNEYLRLRQRDTIAGSQTKADWKAIYDEYQVDGMFALYNANTGKNIFYHPWFYKRPIAPASTFNILLTLIGLEEGIIKDEKSLMKPYGIPLERAFRNNIDSCFIDLSELIGESKINYWLNKISYGNRSTDGEKGRFWINGHLQITPEQQLDFIKNFYYEKFPFSKHAYQTVKRLMYEKKINGLAVYGKRGSNKIYKAGKYTGNLYLENKYTGWFVGYGKGSGNVYFFTNYIESSNLNHPRIVIAQKEIVFKIFKTLNIR